MFALPGRIGRFIPAAAWAAAGAPPPAPWVVCVDHPALGADLLGFASPAQVREVGHDFGVGHPAHDGEIDIAGQGTETMVLSHKIPSRSFQAPDFKRVRQVLAAQLGSP